MSKEKNNNGETKRLKWAALILIPVMLMCGATIGYAASKVGGMDTRVRLVEQDNAVNGERFRAIQETLGEIKDKLKDK